jgi:hypothetical protein
MEMRRIPIFLLLFLSISAFSTMSLPHATISTGSINGTVTDPVISPARL